MDGGSMTGIGSYDRSHKEMEATVSKAAQLLAILGEHHPLLWDAALDRPRPEWWRSAEVEAAAAAEMEAADGLLSLAAQPTLNATPAARAGLISSSREPPPHQQQQRQGQLQQGLWQGLQSPEDAALAAQPVDPLRQQQQQPGQPLPILAAYFCRHAATQAAAAADGDGILLEARVHNSVAVII